MTGSRFPARAPAAGNDRPLGGTALVFTAAGTRSIFSGHVPRRHVPRQLALIALLLATFAFELAGGTALILHPHSAGAAGLVSNLLVALLIIGIVRAWELVGDRATDIISSIAVLTGHDHSPDGPLQHPHSPIRPRPNQLASPDRWHSPGPTAVRSELHLTGVRVRPTTLVTDAKHSGGDAVLRGDCDPRPLHEVRHQRPRARCPARWPGAGPPPRAHRAPRGDHDLLA
jgi:hypothetical protein